MPIYFYFIITNSTFISVGLKLKVIGIPNMLLPRNLAKKGAILSTLFNYRYTNSLTIFRKVNHHHALHPARRFLPEARLNLFYRASSYWWLLPQ